MHGLAWWVPHAATFVEHSAVPPGDAAEELVEGDGVLVPLEAERPPDDVEQCLEFGFAELARGSGRRLRPVPVWLWGWQTPRR